MEPVHNAAAPLAASPRPGAWNNARGDLLRSLHTSLDWRSSSGPSSSLVLVRAEGITEFPLPDGVGQPWSIAAGPDGNLSFTEGFTESTTGLIGRITRPASSPSFRFPTISVPPT